MNIHFYSKKEFIEAVIEYEPYFNAEFMPISKILKLPKISKKITYVLFTTSDELKEIVGFARVQLMPISFNVKANSYYLAKRFIQPVYDIRDVFIFNKYRGQKLCGKFINYITENMPVVKLSLFTLSVLEKNLPACKCYKSAGFISMEESDPLAKLIDTYWTASEISDKLIHMIKQ